MIQRDADSAPVTQLVLRGRNSQTLVQNAADWHALGEVAAQMLFWCGGSVYAARCEASEMRFALGLARAPVAAMAKHLSSGYAAYLRQHRGWHGRVFKRYQSRPLLDASYLDDLVIWLHRNDSKNRASAAAWTTEAAYLAPGAMPWVSTARIFKSVRDRAPRSAYRWLGTQSIHPATLADFAGKTRPRTRKSTTRRGEPPKGPHEPLTLQTIAQLVANYCHVSFDDMKSSSRRREVSRAKVIATVLATRHGASVADAARLFNRSRSTLTEQAKYYRLNQPALFMEAEAAIEAFLTAARP